MVIHTLLKLLQLEKAQGARNRAVIGGLEKFKQTWEQESANSGIPERFKNKISEFLTSYENFSSEKRIDSIIELINIINNEVIPLIENSDNSSNDHSNSNNTVLPKEQNNDHKPTRTNNNLVPIESLPGLDSPLTVLPGIGHNRAELLKKLLLFSIGDLLYFFPRRYDDYSQLKTINHIQDGESISIMGTVQKISTFQIRKSKRLLTQATLSDSSGSIQLNWFNNPYIERQLRPGMQIVVSGKVNKYFGKFVITHPTWEPLDSEHLHTNRLVPIYPSTSGITQRMLRTITSQCVNHWAPKIPEILPQPSITKYDLVSLPDAVKHIHYPENEHQIEAARNRLAFDEIFMLQLGVLQQKYKWETSSAQKYEISDEMFNQFIKQLPFRITSSQFKAMSEIRMSLSETHPMNRLLQGDVGSGKTVVAALALLIVSLRNVQSAIMAPTSILANQHLVTLRKLLCFPGGFLPEQIRLLTSEIPEAEKEEIRISLLNGSIRILVGTHALIEDPIRFQNLQLAIIDEQHRFGVDQRTLLREKGSNPHLLVMSATPIPRSLALTIYGDLDLSVLDEMPEGRMMSTTTLHPPTERDLVYQKITDEVTSGHQVFIIYPLIDQSEEEENTGVIQEFDRLRNTVFKQFKIGLLHGRLSASEKQQIMQIFRDGEIHILISTTVIEVGMDIPNATVIVIESANRFGLAQLHQLRGRVGRGINKSYCFLITDADDDTENLRLNAMIETNDGFILAEKDLAQRGPGDFLGARQVGFVGFKMADFSDIHLIEKARECAKDIFMNDKELTSPEHQNIKKAYNRYWLGIRTDIS